MHHLPCSLSSAQTVRDSHGEVESGLFSLLFLKSCSCSYDSVRDDLCRSRFPMHSKAARRSPPVKYMSLFFLPQLRDWDCGSREICAIALLLVNLFGNGCGIPSVSSDGGGNVRGRHAVRLVSQPLAGVPQILIGE